MNNQREIHVMVTSEEEVDVYVLLIRIQGNKYLFMVQLQYGVYKCWTVNWKLLGSGKIQIFFVCC